MKRVIILFAVLMLTFSISVLTGTQAATPPKPGTAPAAVAPSHPAMHPRAPYEAEGISRYFAAASRYYKEGKLMRSARELYMAADELDKIAAKATEATGKTELKQRAEDLRMLAKQVEDGKVKSEAELDRAYGRAYLALADLHYKVAKASWTKTMTSETGKELEKAGDYLEEAATWGGRTIDSATDTTVRKTRDLSMRIEKREKYTKEEIGEAVKDVGERVKELGTRIEKENQGGASQR